jgi:hypothetical protein
MVTLTTGLMSLLFPCMHLWVWGMQKMVRVCADWKVVRDCLKFEKHLCKRIIVILLTVYMQHYLFKKPYKQLNVFY